MWKKAYMMFWVDKMNLLTKYFLDQQSKTWNEKTLLGVNGKTD